ncbi:MAG TPA: GNAT family protein [Streptosporangiaceae bacterium]|nr:GNAT family protein [Streptosporangiaceae bacterium]
MTDSAGLAGAPSRPTLAGDRVRLRPGDQRDVAALCAILAEPTVARWWGDPESAGQGRGIGTEAVGLLARFLCEQRGRHRLTIDPARNAGGAGRGGAGHASSPRPNGREERKTA